MSSSRASATAYRFELKASRRLALALDLAHGAAVLAVLLTPMPVAWRGFGLMAVLGLWFWHRRRYRLPALAGIVRRGETWYELGRDAPLVLASHWHTPWLALLNFRAEDGRRYDLAVLPDMLPDADWRRLSQILRGFL